MTATVLAAPLRVAVIGAGYFAQFHHDAWRRIDRAELIAVADRDMAKAEATGAVAFDDPARMLAAERVDIVDVVTPPETHVEFISLALEHKVRAIVCQKPFCGELEQARRAVALAESAGVPLIVHENFRFQPWYRTLKSEIAGGRVGRVRQVTFRLRPGDGQGPDAYLARQPYFQTMPRFLIHETAVHWIDTFRYLLGEPQAVYADLRRLNPAIAGEDAGLFVFGYPDGARAIFDGNRLLDHAAKDRRRTMGECVVEGDAGEIRLYGDGSLRFRAHGENAETVIAAAPQAPGFGGDCVRALQAHVVDGLLDQTPIENDAGSYLRNLELESLVYEAAATGRRIEISP